MKHSVKHVSEYLFLKLFAVLLRAIPHRAALFIGWLNAWFVFYVCRFRVNEAKRRIKTVLGENLSNSSVNEIAWHSWKNIVFSGVEMIRMDMMSPKVIESDLEGEKLFSTLKKQTDSGKGGIAAVAHMGSWELAGFYAHQIGIPVFTFVAKQRNPLINAYLNQLREKPGIKVISRGTNSIETIIKRLNNGDLLAILPDVRMRREGLTISFLGGKANIGKGMALFARRCNVPIFPCIFMRHGWVYHKGKVGPTIWPDPKLDMKSDVQRMTREVFAIIEDAIRESPGQWFWFNKRWVLDPLHNS